MSHEQSQTVQGQDGRWYNLSGLTGEPLVPILSTERPSYDTVEEAVAAAQARSRSFDIEHPQPATPARPAQPATPAGPDLSTGRIPQLRKLSDLIEALGPKPVPRVGSPSGETTPTTDMISAGAGAILDDPDRTPVATRRFEPDTLTDAEPVHEQLLHAEERFPGLFYNYRGPRPGEPTTTREFDAFEQDLKRYEKLHDIAVSPGEA